MIARIDCCDWRSYWLAESQRRVGCSLSPHGGLGSARTASSFTSVQRGWAV